MKFDIQKWTIEELLKLYEERKLNLNPPYQRNPIWSKKAQRQLIDSIIQGFPLPTFFLFKNGNDTYEMVDGQQRTRALLLYKNTNEIDETSDKKGFKTKGFLEYQLAITLIEKIDPGEYIEEFYDRVNSQGLRLNRPETLKAKYFNTRFLELVEKLTSLDEFQSLEIVPPNSQKRMQDRDLVEELVALLLFGITDKKNQVDKIYESDIDKVSAKKASDRFKLILSHLTRFNRIKRLKETRYRQRNDIYTLFNFLDQNKEETDAVLDYFYNVLIAIDPGIRPSRTACKPLANYAYACVTQSNSSVAREERLQILNSLLKNTNRTKPNESQKLVMDYYNLNTKSITKIGQFITFDYQALNEAIIAFEIEEEE